MKFYQPRNPAVGITFQRLDVNSYMVGFLDTDKHTPDMICWILKEEPGFRELVSFVETKKMELNEDNKIGVEIHLKQMCDVAELIAKASARAAQSVGVLRDKFKQALQEFG